MKAIMISIKPKWVAKILNGEKTIEIRKTMPKCDLPIDVYIYCTKNSKQELCYVPATETFYCYPKDNIVAKQCDRMGLSFNGKVVAKFTLNYVGRLKVIHDDIYDNMVIPNACITHKELEDYLKDNVGYAWHISNLEIFDRPRELCEFHTNIKKEPPEELLCPECGKPMEYYEYKYLTKAPQSWCYVEVEE